MNLDFENCKSHGSFILTIWNVNVRLCFAIAGFSFVLY